MAETMRLFGGVLNRLRRLTSGCFVELSDRRAAPAPASRVERIAECCERWPTLPRQTVMQMKPFHAAAVILAVAAFGVGQSAAQTTATVPGSIGVTSPLGAGFSDPAGSSQSAAVPYSGGANLAPCSAGTPVMPALPTFDGVLHFMSL